MVLTVPNLKAELGVPLAGAGGGPGWNAAGGAAGLASGNQHVRHVSFQSLNKHLLCICKKKKENKIVNLHLPLDLKNFKL